MGDGIILGLSPDGIAQAILALATMGVLIATIRHNHSRSQNETVVEFNRRYEKLWEYIHDKSSQKEHEFDTENLIRRYWSLQLDQYQAWCRGFVPDEQYRYWLKAREADFSAQTKIGDQPYSESARIAQQSIKASHFWDLMRQAEGGFGDNRIKLPRKYRLG